MLFSREKVHKSNFKRFWYSHHLFIVLLINKLAIMARSIYDRPHFCSPNTVSVFWIVEHRIPHEVRSLHITYISKVIEHPSNVMELRSRTKGPYTLPFLSRSLLFPMASLHADQIVLAILSSADIIILC